jgi:hypothetical protein
MKGDECMDIMLAFDYANDFYHGVAFSTRALWEQYRSAEGICW